VAPRSPDTAAGRWHELVESVAIAALQRRIQERREKNVSRFGSCGAFLSLGVNGRFIQHGIEVQTAAARWTEAAEFAESELRRARARGFDEAEIKEAIAAY